MDEVQCPLRVLWLVKGLGPGGVEMLLAQHAEHANPNISYAIAYVVPTKDHLVGRFNDAGVVTHCLASRGPWDCIWFYRLARLLRVGDFDVVHAHSPFPAAILRILVWLLFGNTRPAVITTEHNMWQRYSLWTRIIAILTYWANDESLAVSAGVKDSFPRWIRNRITVNHAGVDTDILQPIASVHHGREQLRSGWGVTPEQILVGVVANYRVQKDYPNLFQAAKVLAAAGSPLRFICVGQGPLAAEMASQVRDLGIGATVNLVGFRADIAEVLAACDLFCLSSRYEGLPVAMLEAMAMGLGVVATRVGGVPEVVTSGREGLLVPPGSPSSLAGALAQMASDAEMRERCCQAARRRSLDFSSLVSIRFVERLYADLAARARSRPPGVRRRNAERGRSAQRAGGVVHLLPTNVGRGAQIFAWALRDHLNATVSTEGDLAGDDNPVLEHQVVTLFHSLPGPLLPDIALRSQGRFRAYGLDPLTVIRLNKYLVEARPRLVVVHGGESMKYISVLPRRTFRVIYKKTGSTTPRTRFGIQTKFYSWIARQPDAVVCLSQENARELIEDLRAPCERVHVIPNGRDSGLFKPASPRPFHSRCAWVVTCGFTSGLAFAVVGLVVVMGAR
ncbi:MAG: glycosyltransferase [Acidimicrobiales bacterium]